jgi:anti-sigma factor RsiW
MISHVSERRMHQILDGELSSSELEHVERHVATCASCRERFARMSETVRDLGSLPKLASPPVEAWERIAERIGRAPPGRPADVAVLALPVARARARLLTLSLPQLGAVAAVVAALWVGALALGLRMAGGEAAVGSETALPAGVGPAARAVAATGVEYDRVVEDLERIVEEGRGVLAPETLLTIEESLATVDLAIAEVREALASDPSSEILVRMLATHERTRLGVLERAARAVRAQT